MTFPPLHPLSSHIELWLYNQITLTKGEKMNRRDELYWADKERIRRAEEIRRKIKKKEVKK